MKVDAMIAIGKHMDVVILDAGQVQLVEQGQRVLHVHVVVGDAVHDEEAHVGPQRRHVADGGICVALWVVLGRVHVAFRVDGV